MNTDADVMQIGAVQGVGAAAEIVTLLIDDDDGADVYGLYGSEDDAVSDFRRYLVDRFGEDAVGEAEADEEQGLASLVAYRTSVFPSPVPAPAVVSEVWLLTVDHRHGRDCAVFRTERDAVERLAEWVRQYWGEVVGQEYEDGAGARHFVPALPPIDGAVATEVYFAAKQGDESYVLGREPIAGVLQ
ncbi:hypothetical protein [Mycobacteroides abscessus]|uniref:Uncharacterized protein n=1 Tax=Mycobacteroides abscessus TaxID=36809 RepID=A0ABD7HMH4_9MYCO|nr:hypothetical protein [Mycobacteroides abscessus]MBN7457669.1 hypothetical protein [Mycobacteroides abscessus subsp. abscessus]RIT36898.1 hypothetical protein D2E76_16760 [Mycobacteroides abscessus]